ncbi:DUF4178 domain-containing protein [Kiloniella sp. EL199]|uniref:DUF4178 domain-containing protein n=1 Tax=Kiloniella sp. EL199 TaxID=2107581 RepID=UPI000EA017CC|nr:DUF4178 domain-containing protein [Kiloniella sp. EL199]
MSTLFLIFLILAIGALIGIYIVNKKKQGPASNDAAATHTAQPSVENLQKGGVFRVNGFGERLDDMDFLVLDRHEYREGNYKWFELECETGNEKIWINVERDDDLEITVSTSKMRLAELGISKEDLQRFDNDEDGSFSYEGKKFYYEDSGSAQFFRAGDMSNAQDFYYWEFESEEDPRFIGVERWSDGSFEVHVSEAIRESRITVYSNSGGE